MVRWSPNPPGIIFSVETSGHEWNWQVSSPGAEDDGSATPGADRLIKHVYNMDTTTLPHRPPPLDQTVTETRPSGRVWHVNLCPSPSITHDAHHPPREKESQLALIAKRAFRPKSAPSENARLTISILMHPHKTDGTSDIQEHLTWDVRLKSWPEVLKEKIKQQVWNPIKIFDGNIETLVLDC